MHHIKKSVAIIGLFIITATGCYIFNNKVSSNQSTANITDQLTTNELRHITNTASDKIKATSFTSPMIGRKKNVSTETKVDINMPKSLHNTEPSSLVHVDSDNQLVLNHDIKVLFDYFFSSEGDLSPEELLASMQQYIEQAYPQPAAKQALRLLNKYLNYKQQMGYFYAQNTTLQDLPELDSLSNRNTLQTVETLMQNRQDMRESIFSTTETDAMFGQEINYDQYMLTIAKLDADLSPTERQQQIAQTAEQYLTVQQRESRKQTFILQSTPPNFSINSDGVCQGNDHDFTAQQVTALCKLARDRLTRSN